MIDLDRAGYSHCNQTKLDIDPSIEVVEGVLLNAIIGAEHTITRHTSYLQGGTTDLAHDYEFRSHYWFTLPNGHPSFQGADRGLAYLIQGVTAEGLEGPAYGGVGWLGRPIEGWTPWDPSDWVMQMVHDQGYFEMTGAEWRSEISGLQPRAVLAHRLGIHLIHMMNHQILEELLIRKSA